MIVRPLVASLLVAAAGDVRAEFHGSLACNDCHGQPRAGDAAERELSLCLRCHDGGHGAAPDVLRATSPQPRAGGFFSRVGDGVAEFTGHTLGSQARPPGFTGYWPAGTHLVCSSCHAIHANGKYRNLGRDPYISEPGYVELSSTLFSDANEPTMATVPDANMIRGAVGADVFVSSEGTASAYDPARTALSTNGGRNAMNGFCASCHASFHGPGNTEAKGGGDGFARHPTSGVAMRDSMQRRVASSVEPMRVAWRDDATAEVSCLSCHRAHGTSNAFGLVHWSTEAEKNGESGAGPLFQSLCLSCHSLP